MGKKCALFIVFALVLVSMASAIKYTATAPFDVKWISAGLVKLGDGTADSKIFLYVENKQDIYVFSGKTYDIKFYTGCFYFRLSGAQEWTRWLPNEILNKWIAKESGVNQNLMQQKISTNIDASSNQLVINDISSPNMPKGVFSSPLAGIDFQQLINLIKAKIQAVISGSTSAGTSNTSTGNTSTGNSNTNTPAANNTGNTSNTGNTAGAIKKIYTSYAEAKAASAQSGLPLILFGGNPSCPLCQKFNAEILTRAEFNAMSGVQFVFAKLYGSELSKVPQWQGKTLKFPELLFLDPTGKVIADHQGPITKEELFVLIVQLKSGGMNIPPAATGTTANTPPAGGNTGTTPSGNTGTSNAATCTDLYNQNGIKVQKCTDVNGTNTLKVCKGTECQVLPCVNGATQVARFSDNTQYDITVNGTQCTVVARTASGSNPGATGASCVELYNKNGFLVQKCTDVNGKNTLKVCKGTECQVLPFVDGATQVARFSDNTQYDILVKGTQCTVTNKTPAPGGTNPGGTNGGGTTPASSSSSAEELRVLTLCNAERSKAGLKALKWAENLAACGRAHSKDMANRGYFDHVTPEGKGPSHRLQAAGIQCYGCAENIAMMPSSPEAVVNGWMNSSGHRANILGSYNNYMGCGKSGSYWTQMFSNSEPTGGGGAGTTPSGGGNTQPPATGGGGTTNLKAKYTSYNEAASAAQSANLPLVVVISKSWCGPCMALKRDSIESAEFTNLCGKQFVFLYLFDSSSSEEMKVPGYSGGGIPQTFIFRPVGSQVKKQVGKPSHTDFMNMINQYTK